MIDDSKTDSVSPGENLSALLDGELPPEQTGFLLKRVERDADLRATLQRYQIVGDTLRGERVRARPDFALRVSAAIAAEPPLPAPDARPADVAREPSRSRRAPAWLKPLAGLAVAASVASVAVVVMQRDPDAGAPAVVASTQAPASTAPVSASVASSSLAPANAVVANSFRSEPANAFSSEPASYVTPPASVGTGIIPPAQLANYVVAHSEYSSPLGRRNVLTGLIAGETLAAPETVPAVEAPVTPAR